MNQKKNQGITLIALVVTIIVLLVLAGISIQMLTGQNGILNRASEAKKKTEFAEMEEKIKLAYANAVATKYANNGEDINNTVADLLQEELEKTYEIGNVTVYEDPKGYDVIINETIYRMEDGKVTEKELATLISISNATLTIDGSYLLTAKVSSGSAKDVIWSSENKNIATVTGEGVVKCGTETGTTKIKCQGKNTMLECTVTSTAKIIDVNNEENRTVNGQDGSYTNPTLPTGFMAVDTYYAKWSKTGEQTDVNKGLVIMDIKGNEFVWVPVQTAVATTEQEATTNKAMAFQSGSNYVGVLYAFVNSDGRLSSSVLPWNLAYREPDTLPSYDGNKGLLDNITNILTNQTAKYADASTFYSTMKEEYRLMIESVKKFGGFYIGRYESSLINNKTRVVAGATSMNASNALSFRWYGLYARQKKFAQDNRLTSVESSMMWGSQYDAMMNWMLAGSIDVTSNTPTTPENTTMSRNTSRKTGTEQSDKINNIFDILGNSYEWTLEARNVSYRVRRGGCYSSACGLCWRQDYDPIYGVDLDSSRPTLYIK